MDLAPSLAVTMEAEAKPRIGSGAFAVVLYWRRIVDGILFGWPPQALLGAGTKRITPKENFEGATQKGTTSVL